ncbi:hypothetical protein [Undibacterium fentianense]|uniref:Uncharacterized protein n=1 Tax=Undibacterium fentianense TaxID=2828728 RepID=A0A941E1J3_9BURK|nr:hypothetical protein [Undibacterium fentianense]MBR7800695.1 hypothetical protein [Undibacterium fentianense]
MSEVNTRPSELVLLQRVRNQLIDYLEIAASFQAQQDFQTQAPETDVATEVLEQWADWVSPDWREELRTPTFSEQERTAIGQYQLIWEQTHNNLVRPLPALVYIHLAPAWQELRVAAERCLAVFMVRGKLSDMEEATT